MSQVKLLIVKLLLGVQGQGVLSDKLRSFSMQDLTLINADDELGLRTSDPRVRRDPVDDMSSGASTLPRARSAAGRQSKTSPSTLICPHLPMYSVRAYKTRALVLLRSALSGTSGVL